jgi:hypothetical protein
MAMRWMLILVVLLLFSCAGTREPVKEEPAKETKPQYDESFDPLSLNDDDIIIAANAVKTPEEQTPVENTEEQKVQRETTGYRVQILATKNIETASLFEQEASERFDPLGHQTYLVFEAPLYKIRLGDCKDRAEAEVLRDTAVEYGYRESFIVKCKIHVQD